MTTVCSKKQKTDRDLFRLLRDELYRKMNLHLEEDDHFITLKDKGSVIAIWSATGVTIDEIRDTANVHMLNSCKGLELRLLRFWGRNPRAKLSLYTIASALDTARIHLRYAITSLVEKGILKEQRSSNGLTTYALTNEQRIREYVDDVVKLDWSDINVLGNQLKGEAISV